MEIALAVAAVLAAPTVAVLVLVVANIVYAAALEARNCAVHVATQTWRVFRDAFAGLISEFAVTRSTANADD